MARVLNHYIGGKTVAGTSGRFDDVFDPDTGAVQAKVPLATWRGCRHHTVQFPGDDPALEGCPGNRPWQRA
jgi:hypothetical protein